MKVRLSLTVDFELSDRDVHERYGAYDVQTVAQSMQTEADQHLTEQFRGDPRVVNANCTVHPLYG